MSYIARLAGWILFFVVVVWGVFFVFPWVKGAIVWWIEADVDYAQVRSVFLQWDYETFLQSVPSWITDNELSYWRVISLLKIWRFDQARKELVHASSWIWSSKDLQKILVLLREWSYNLAKQVIIWSSSLDQPLREQSTNQMLYAYASFFTNSKEDIEQNLLSSLENDPSASFTHVLYDGFFARYGRLSESTRLTKFVLDDANRENEHLFLKYYAWLGEFQSWSYEDAIMILSELWQLNSDNHLIPRGRVWYYLWRSYFHVEQYDNAMNFVDQMLIEFPDHTAMYIWKSRALRDTGDVEEAFSVLSDAYQVNPRDAEIVIDMLDILADHKDSRKLRKVFWYVQSQKEIYPHRHLYQIIVRIHALGYPDEASLLLSYLLSVAPEYELAKEFHVKMLLQDYYHAKYTWKNISPDQLILLSNYVEDYQSAKKWHSLLLLDNDNAFYAQKILADLAQPISVQEGYVYLTILRWLYGDESVRDSFDLITADDLSITTLQQDILLRWIADRMRLPLVKSNAAVQIQERRWDSVVKNDDQLRMMFEKEFYWYIRYWNNHVAKDYNHVFTEVK